MKANRRRVALALILSLFVGCMTPVSSTADATEIRDRSDDVLQLVTPVHSGATINRKERGKYKKSDWFQRDIGAYEAAESIRMKAHEPGDGIVIAVVDTGLETTHPAFTDSLWTNELELYGEDGVDDDGNGYIDDVHGANIYDPGTPMEDTYGHGTELSGILAMHTDFSQGVSPGVKIMPIKIGSGKDFSIGSAVSGVRYAVNNGADIINLSFGTTTDYATLRHALEAASRTCVLVAAAGNTGDSTENPVFPAAYDFVTGVMAYGSNGKITSFSNWDNDPGSGYEYEIAAPGKTITTTTKGRTYATKDGTSYATAVVSGTMAVALSELKHRRYHMNADAFKKWFLSTQKKWTVSDEEHQFLAYPKLSMKDALDDAENYIQLDSSEAASVSPDTQITPKPTPTKKPVSKTKKRLKTGTRLKGGKGRTRAYYVVNNSKEQTVIFDQCLVKKTYTTATIPSRVKLRDGRYYTVVGVKAYSFSKRPKIKSIYVYSSYITTIMMKNAIRGSDIVTIIFN